MGEIADDMLGGVMCEGCGEYLNCAIEDPEDGESCEEMGIPMYCSLSCAKSRGAGKEQVCQH